jgi:mRNA-degrading endonuclease RelE of RelBE toxin-antitoxin system
MVKIDFDEHFKRTVSKIKDASVKERIQKLIFKIRDNPEIGKPMKHNRKGTRELYLSPFRLSYYDKMNGIIVILALYHKDEQ